MSCWRVLLGIMVGLAASGPVVAGLKLEFEANGHMSNSFEISSPGQTLSISVYLSQDQDGLLNLGLTSALFDVKLNDPAIAMFGGVEPNADWGVDFSVITPTLAEMNLLSGDGVVAPYGDENRILLATFAVEGLSPGQTTVSAQEADPDNTGLDNFTDYIDAPLDSFIDYPKDNQGNALPFTATITVNPEPSSLALSLLIAGGGAAVAAVRRRRQRRLSADGDQAEATAS